MRKILRQIQNNFFNAVGLGNCMGFGPLFNKIILDLHLCGEQAEKINNNKPNYLYFTRFNL